MAQISFKDVAHLYLGVEVLYKGEIHFLCGLSTPYKTNDKTLATFSVRPNNKGFRSTSYSLENFDDIKPILRKLESMTQDEDRECHSIIMGEYDEKVRKKNIIHYEGEKIRYLLSKHFDLFGLIDSNQAKDKNSQPVNKG